MLAAVRGYAAGNEQENILETSLHKWLILGRLDDVG